MLLGVSARHVARSHAFTRPLVTCSSYSTSAIKTVPLVYDLHEPAKPVSDDPNRSSPILFMHGLFGSKKNNRSISKYVISAKPDGRNERLTMFAGPLRGILGDQYMLL